MPTFRQMIEDMDALGGKKLRDLTVEERVEWILCCTTSLSVECTVYADVIHILIGSTEPCLAWALRRVEECHLEEGSDYIIKAGIGPEDVIFKFSPNAAAMVILGEPGPVAGQYMKMVTQSVMEYARRPGNEHLRTFEGMMAASKQYSEDNAKLKKLFNN